MYDLLSWDKDGKVNSGYGYRSSASTGGVGSTNHKGIDLSSYNDNVPAVMSGKVVANGWQSARGNYISILGTDGYTTTYQHLASKSPLSIGSSVTEGQTIGTQGSTGASTGKHLHFEVKSGSGLYVNPLDYLSGKLTSGNEITGTTDGHDRPIDNSGSGIAMGIVGKIIKIIVVAAVLVLAAVLFMKAFDIKIM